MIKKLICLFAAVWLATAPAAAFNSPGIISLGDFQISAAAIQVTPPNLQQGLPGGPYTLPGLTALSCQANFQYGSGGATVQVFIQTSLDQGKTWFDIANIGFTTSGAIEAVNLSGLNSVTTPTAPGYLTLANNTTFNGPLGDRLQAQVVSTGTYGGATQVSVRCALR